MRWVLANGRFWWEAACPLSGVLWSKRTLVQEAEQLTSGDGGSGRDCDREYRMVALMVARREGKGALVVCVRRLPESGRPFATFLGLQHEL